MAEAQIIVQTGPAAGRRSERRCDLSVSRTGHPDLHSPECRERECRLIGPPLCERPANGTWHGLASSSACRRGTFSGPGSSSKSESGYRH